MSLLAIARRWEGAAGDESHPLRAVLEELERDGTAAKLRAIAATLTPEEHHRLADEAAEGDRLALLVMAVLASIPRTEAL